jgi:ABC-type enterochelin transport system, permease component
MHPKGKIAALAAFALLLIAAFVFYKSGTNWDYVLPRRLVKIAAIALTGAAIAFATMVFQTITNNRILTPSIIGLDSLYMLIQTFIIFVFGSMSPMVINKSVNFFITVGLMMIFAALLYKVLFKEGRNLFFLLLVGIIFGTFFGSISTFLQVLIDPNEFLIVQDRMFASFNNVNTDILALAFALTALTVLYAMRYAKYLDVLSLGRDHAIGLGVPYDRTVRRLLIVVAVLIAISTALVGPITFLGLLVANVAHELFRTYRHSYLLTGSVLISVIALVGGQFVVERVFTFSTTLSVIINFIGGVYFLYLLLRESKA